MICAGSERDWELSERTGRNGWLALSGSTTELILGAMIASFVTHSAVQRLSGAGFTETQAEALHDRIHQALTGGVASDLATLGTQLVRNENDFPLIQRTGGAITMLLNVPILRDFLAVPS